MDQPLIIEQETGKTLPQGWKETWPSVKACRLGFTSDVVLLAVFQKCRGLAQLRTQSYREGVIRTDP